MTRSTRCTDGVFLIPQAFSRTKRSKKYSGEILCLLLEGKQIFHKKNVQQQLFQDPPHVVRNRIWRQEQWLLADDARGLLAKVHPAKEAIAFANVAADLAAQNGGVLFTTASRAKTLRIFLLHVCVQVELLNSTEEE